MKDAHQEEANFRVVRQVQVRIDSPKLIDVIDELDCTLYARPD